MSMLGTYIRAREKTGLAVLFTGISLSVEFFSQLACAFYQLDKFLRLVDLSQLTACIYGLYIPSIPLYFRFLLTVPFVS